MFSALLVCLVAATASVTAAPSQDLPLAGAWRFDNGGEFPGAAGALETDRNGMIHLEYDFRNGGAYVAAYCDLATPARLSAVSFRARKPDEATLTVRVTDNTGQTFQKSVQYGGRKWRYLHFDLRGWTGHWGGANDGILQQPVKTVGVLVEREGLASARGEVLIADIKGEAGEANAPPDIPEGDLQGQYVVTDFGNTSGFGCSSYATLDNSVWTADLAVTDRVSLNHSLSILGKPREFALKLRGGAPGNLITVQIGSHFQSFTRVVGVLDGADRILTFPPPPEGWEHSGAAENSLSLPLRITSISLERGDGPAAPTKVELAGLWCATAVPRAKPVTLLASLAEAGAAAGTAAETRNLRVSSTAWNLLDSTLSGTLTATTKDWDGAVLDQQILSCSLPANGVRAETVFNIAIPGHLNFAETECRFETSGIEPVSSAATFVKPVEGKGDPSLRPESPWGMGVYLYRYADSPEGYDAMDEAAAMAQTAGVKWSREEFSWAATEPEKGRYDFHFYDKVVETAHRHGISVYGLLAYWSNWTQPYTEQGIDDFCCWARAVVRHFKDRIKHWEIYNEPNIFFWNGPKELYPVLVKKCYAAIKEEDPDAQVLAISTSGIDRGFIKRCVEAGAPFDVLTVHPYRPTLIDRQFIKELDHVAELVGKRPVWITEMGWSTHVGGVSERRQAQLLARCYLTAIASETCRNISWYDFRDDGNDPFYFESNFGVLRQNMSPKPAYRALATVCTSMAAGKPKLREKLGENLCAVEMGHCLAVWSPDTEAEIACKSRKKSWRVLNLMGDDITPKPEKGDPRIALTPGNPVFITGAKVKAIKESNKDHQKDDVVRF